MDKIRIALFAVTIAFVLLLAYKTTTETSVYACSEVSKNDPPNVQKLCAQARKNRPWMK
jgi:hypothetical protein